MNTEKKENTIVIEREPEITLGSLSKLVLPYDNEHYVRCIQIQPQEDSTKGLTISIYAYNERGLPDTMLRVYQDGTHETEHGDVTEDEAWEIVGNILISINSIDIYDLKHSGAAITMREVESELQDYTDVFNGYFRN